MQFNLNGYLDPGIHNADLSDIEEHLVKGFSTSITRPRIIDGYKRHRAELQALNVEFEQFVDGSFVSTKNDPGDIDLVCFADAQAVDQLSTENKQKLRTLVLGPETKQTHYCDAYFCPTVPEHHPNYAQTRTSRKYWMGEFGFDRLDRPKGIVKTIVTIEAGDGL